jgi:hypothetical protein
VFISENLCIVTYVFHVLYSTVSRELVVDIPGADKASGRKENFAYEP